MRTSCAQPGVGVAIVPKEDWWWRMFQQTPHMCGCMCACVHVCIYRYICTLERDIDTYVHIFFCSYKA